MHSTYVGHAIANSDVIHEQAAEENYAQTPAGGAAPHASRDAGF